VKIVVVGSFELLDASVRPVVAGEGVYDMLIGVGVHWPPSLSPPLSCLLSACVEETEESESESVFGKSVPTEEGVSG